ncbi:hypothetical protein BX600DRAFT_447129 [Xylariales sp. PMI_506]|nr:hypothetical protein BX600DRAFT_447129 [Xylariales sp. PMI_506]
MGRACGSIFASTIIDTLCSATSPLLQDPTNASSNAAECKRLQPRQGTTRLQTYTYHAFCQSIMDICGEQIHRLCDEQRFTFSAQDDAWNYSWTGRSGIPLARFEERWTQLPTVEYSPSVPGQPHPAIDPSPLNPLFDSSAQILSHTGGGGGDLEDLWTTEDEEDLQRVPEHLRADEHPRAIELARIFVESCPGDWERGFQVGVGGSLRAVVKGNPDDECPYTAAEVFSLVRFRWEWIQISDRMVSIFGLPKPDNASCAAWHSQYWNRTVKHRIPNYRQIEHGLWPILLNEGFYEPPAEHQGPPFYRHMRYLMAAIVEAQLPENKGIDLARKIAHGVRQCREETRQIATSRVCQSRPIRSLAKDWFQSLGRSIRRSLSPSKSDDSGVSMSGTSGHQLGIQEE